MEITQPPTTSFAVPSAVATSSVMRLTALWALIESGLGGVLHALHLPVTGVVVGGTAVVLITLIAHFADHPRRILKATLLVLIVKALVSPHSPLGAYVAVAFQGVVGWAIYALLRPSLVATGLFAVVALLESALQKLLMLTLFFGAPLWQAIDQWGSWVQQQFFAAPLLDSLATTLLMAYIALHVLAGLLIGWVAYRLPAEIAREQAELSRVYSFESPESITISRKKRYCRRWLIVGLVLAGMTLYLLTLSDTDSPLSLAGFYLLRTVLVLGVWYAWLAPTLTHLVRRWLLRRQGQYGYQVDVLLAWLPVFKRIAYQQYRHLSQDHHGWALYRIWMLRTVALALTIHIAVHHDA